MFGVLYEVVHGFLHVLQDLFGRGRGFLVEGLDHAVGPEEGLGCVGGFRDSVCVEEDLVAGLEVDLIFLVPGVFHAADDQAVAVLEEGEAAVLHQGRIFVAGVGGPDDACADFEDADPDSDEHFQLVVPADGVVGLFQDLGGGDAQHGVVLEDHLGDHHEEGGGDALAGDVRDAEAEVVVVDQEEIVKIPSDLPGGVHGGVNIKFTAVREGREFAGQHAVLDAGGHLQLGADPFLFHLFPVLFFYRRKLTADVEVDEHSDSRKREENAQGIKRGVLEQGLLFDDPDGGGPVFPAHGVPEPDREFVASSGQVCVVYGVQVASADGGLFPVKSLQLPGYLGIGQRIVIDIAVDRYFPDSGRNPEVSAVVGVDPDAVCIQIGDGDLECVDIFKRRFDIDLGDSACP